MSKTKKKVTPKKKKVVVSSTKKTNSTTTVVAPKKKIKPTRSKRNATVSNMPKQELIFGKQNYILMGLGFGLIILGMALMSGGQMPSPDVWDEVLFIVGGELYWLPY